MSLLRSAIFTAMVAMFMFVTACESGGTATRQVVDNSAPTQAQTNTAYTLGTGDKLRINVFGQPELSGQFVIDGTGAISLPLIGQVAATGSSSQELETAIAEKLSDGFLLEPRVSVEVTNYRPFYILGEVGRPGEYPFNSGLTVLNAVAAAGGFTYRANKKVVYIKSVGAEQEVKYELNTNTVVKPGDTLRVSERIF
ncbi:polysaccharide biosynthesis/export family protein [Hyphomonas oceanitis]|uniref:Polysaccharide biosynthesis/export protein n=1 Tax=Hyphomonas oceanitis SCH89 TaxID=1280953 RepID=A0A059G3A1_9PROT|nr:polysaccharide biosynthesis/export family protein [Hyphomonas oceanitis]KDA01332.1 polysaccharide biosynthesis/export protein [Hyphomonas oceanitis SCH89]